VKYAVDAPGGAWDEADNGPYDVRLRDGAVSDAAGNAVPGGIIASVNVNITAASLGTTPDTAIDFGVLPLRSRKVLRDLLDVALDKPGLYYRFTLTDVTRLCISLGGLRGNADLELLNADGTPVTSSAKAGRRSEKINRVTAPGTYLVRVVLNGATKTPFKLSLLAKVPSKKALAAANLLATV